MASKPEELVAKLYDSGMSEDEIKKQLEEFGLSGREVHNMLKKAKELRQNPDSTPVEDEKKASFLSGMFSKKEAEKPKLDVPGKGKVTLEDSRPKKADPAKEDKKKDEDALRSKKPADALDMAGSDVSQNEDAKKLEELNKLFGDEGGLGDADETQKATEGKAKPPTVEADEPKKVKKGFLAGLFGHKDEKKPDSEPKKGAREKNGAFDSNEKIKLEKKPDSDEKKGVLGGIFGKKGAPDAKGKEMASKTSDEKKDDKRDKKLSKKDLNQAKMKRLSLIKDAISSQKVSPVEEKMELEKMEKEPEDVLDEAGDDKLASAYTRDWKSTSEDYEDVPLIPPKDEHIGSKETEIDYEEKMDKEIADKLTKGIDDLQGQMGELKELLETIRELNVKLVEVLEKK